MGETASLIVYLFVIVIFIMTYVKKIKKSKSGETSAMPHAHTKPGQHVTFNKKSIFNESGAMPHKHETKKYTSMSDASKLPPGYILLNGEPVRVADLDGK